MPLGSKSIKSLSREYTYREDEMTDEYACGDVARMPTSLLPGGVCGQTLWVVYCKYT